MRTVLETVHIPVVFKTKPSDRILLIKLRSIF